MRKAIVILTLLTILISCQKKYKSIENISHLEYLGLKGKIKEMNVSFFIDELSNSVFVPKEKTDLIGFNFLGRELNVYPNIGFNLTSDDCIIDANILKHVLISYIGNPKEIHYFFNDNGDVSKILMEGEFDNNKEEKLFFYDEGRISKIITNRKIGKDALDNSIENFKYDNNNLLISRNFINTGKYGKIERLSSYSYEFNKDKIIVTNINKGLQEGKIKFEIYKQDNVLNINLPDYKLKFNGVFLQSVEEFNKNQIKESIKNTFTGKQIISKEFVENLQNTEIYVKYNFIYENQNLSGIETQKKDGISNYNIKYDFDSKDNWTEMKIYDKSSFDYYKNYEQQKKVLDENKYYMDEFDYKIKKAFIEANILALKLLKSQKRCNREIIYY